MVRNSVRTVAYLSVVISLAEDFVHFLLDCSNSAIDDMWRAYDRPLLTLFPASAVIRPKIICTFSWAGPIAHFLGLTFHVCSCGDALMLKKKKVVGDAYSWSKDQNCTTIDYDLDIAQSLVRKWPIDISSTLRQTSVRQIKKILSAGCCRRWAGHDCLALNALLICNCHV